MTVLHSAQKTGCQSLWSATLLSPILLHLSSDLSSISCKSAQCTDGAQPGQLSLKVTAQLTMNHIADMCPLTKSEAGLDYNFSTVRQMTHSVGWKPRNELTK